MACKLEEMERQWRDDAHMGGLPSGWFVCCSDILSEFGRRVIPGGQIFATAFYNLGGVGIPLSDFLSASLSCLLMGLLGS